MHSGRVDPAAGAAGPRVLVAGCGDVGLRVARAERAAGAEVTVHTRSGERAGALGAEGFVAVCHDLDSERPFSLPPGTIDRLYYLVPPPSRGRRDPRIGRFLAGLQGGVRRFVLLSTTAVYGDCGGARVDERRPPAPAADRGHRRLDAERRLADWAAAGGAATVVLRVAGIYGPGRLPVARLERREPVLREDLSPWSNRIHVDDLVTALLAAGERAPAGAVYNVADDRPSTMTDYFNRVADALGLPRPPQIGPGEAGRLSAGMRSYLAESRRIDNGALRRELGVDLRYPDLASGLAALATASAEVPQ